VHSPKEKPPEPRENVESEESCGGKCGIWDAEQQSGAIKSARSRAETKTKESKTLIQRKCREKSVLFSGLLHFIAFSSRKLVKKKERKKKGRQKRVYGRPLKSQPGAKGYK